MDQGLPLPQKISEGLTEFLEDARNAFGPDLLSAVLFGSAAEGRLRGASDVNLLLLLRRFEVNSADMIREAIRTAHASMHLEVLFLLESELKPATEAFAVKFSDILSRRRVLFGPDPFAALVIPPEAVRRRTLQVLLNLMLRMRERYALVSLREEQLTHVVADMAGPMRACATSILALEGRIASSPREALAIILAEKDPSGGGEVVNLIDRVRREGALPPGTVGPLLFTLMGLAEFMFKRLNGVSVTREGADV